MYGISQAIAARFVPALVTPPAGMQNIRTATAGDPAHPLQAMPPLPAVVVTSIRGQRDLSRNTTRIFDHIFEARFYYSQAGDMTRDMAALNKWATVLVDQLRGAVQFAGSIPYVTRASVDGYHVGYLKFADKDYASIIFDVGVQTSEPWAAIA
jgi:hypothetical protein